MNNNQRLEMVPSRIDVTRLHRQLGAIPGSADESYFCVWAPYQRRIRIVDADTGNSQPLERQDGGFHAGQVRGLRAGSRYWVQLENNALRPDPTSRYQPEGVHESSCVVSSQYEWTDGLWPGIERRDLVIYEIHVGTFTNEGTYCAAIERLDELVKLGITAIELMPLNQSAGRWNWGYDGVNWFAPQHTYGCPDDLRRFVDVAHNKGLAVIVDVVYNHFGPEGNYLGDFGGYLSDSLDSPWGPAPNLDGADAQQLRRWMIANVLHWIEEYHMDGLRVDAVHCIGDTSDVHWVREMADAVRLWGEDNGRQPLLIAESNVYDPQMTAAPVHGGFGFDGLWSDCFLQSVFALVRPADQLSVREYTPIDLDRVLEQGYVYEGTIGSDRRRVRRCDRPDMQALIYSIQHHDCIGNHPLGQRLHQLTNIATQHAAAALLLLSPGTPMLFMGEEFSCESPFNFFVDFSDTELQEAVIKGRKSEYPQRDWSDGVSPVEPAAMERSRIGSSGDGNRDTWQWYQKLIALRKQLSSAKLLDQRFLVTDSDVHHGIYQLRYQSGAKSLLLLVRLSSSNDTYKSAVAFTPLVSHATRLVLDSLANATGPLELLPNHARVYVDGDFFSAGNPLRNGH